MTSPQNGINGNISKPHNQFYYSSYVHPKQNQNINRNGINDTQHTLSTRFKSQDPTVTKTHNPANNMQTQYALYQCPTVFPQSPTFNPYTIMPNFMQPYQFAYNEHPTPVRQNPVPRRISRLTVTDPINNTDLDLKKFQNQTSSQISNGVVLENGKCNLIKEESNVNLKSLSEECTPCEEIIQKEKDPENIPNGECNICTQNPEDREIVKTEEGIHNQEGKESIQNQDGKESNQSYESDIKIETEVSIKDIRMEDVKQEGYIVGKSQISIEEDGENKESITKEYDNDDAMKIESSIESVDEGFHTQNSNNEEERFMAMSDQEPSKYNLQIIKKESDEATLRRKLIYDRQYLISIKNCSRSQKNPINLPNTCDFSEIIYNESQNIVLKKPQSAYSSFKKQVRSGPKITKLIQPKCIMLDNNENKVFERLKSSYLPPQLRTKDKEVDHSIELKRAIKCNLNRITPQNFQECLSNISKLNISGIEDMSCLISEIFIKAVKEEAYSVTYAQFCNKLSDMYTESQSFKGQLLKKCQDMFQTPILYQLENVKTEWMLKIDNESDPKIKNLYASDLEEQINKAKDRYFGNIRFIGELFLHNLLAGKVILNCINELLQGKNDADSLLALCKLLETCGKQIDDRHKEQMNSFIRSIESLSQSKELETRIRFKLRDIIDMRKRGWSLRHIQQQKKIDPKTMEEQKEEAIAEAANKKIASQIVNKRPHQSIPNRTALRRQISATHKPLSLKNLTFPPHIVDDKTVLGPASGNWSSGSGAKPKRGNVEGLIPNLQRSVSYAPSRDHSPQVSGVDSRPSSPSINSAKNITKAYRIKTEISSVMPDDERGDIIFKDLMSTNKFDDDSFLKIRNLKCTIEKWIDDMMEKDVNCRRCLGDNFQRLITGNKMTQMQLVEGFQTFVSNIKDLLDDIPKLWSYLAEFLERFICHNKSEIGFFRDIFRRLLPNNDVALCISSTLHMASSRLGHNIVGKVFHKSSLKWNQFVVKDWEKFVEKNDLTFTIEGGAPLSSFGGSSLQFLSDGLDFILLKDTSNEDIFKYLEKHVDEPTSESSEYTRTITICILKAIKNMPILAVRDYLKDKSEVIKIISKKKKDNEIEVLRSVLNVANQLDNEMLTIVYDVIMTGKVVSTDTFDHYLRDVSLQSERDYKSTCQIISRFYAPVSR